MTINPSSLTQVESDTAALLALSQRFPQCIAIQKAYQTANFYLTLFKDDGFQRVSLRPSYMNIIHRCRETAEKEVYQLDNYRQAEILVAHMYPNAEC
jgi:hypothetical protein